MRSLCHDCGHDRPATARCHLEPDCRQKAVVAYRDEAQRRRGAVNDDLEGYRRAGVNVTPEVAETTRRRHGYTLDDLDALQRQHGLIPYRQLLQEAGEARGRAQDGAGLESRLQKLGVPWRALASLRQLQDCQLIDLAKKFMAADRSLCPLLTLVGPTGIGKTVASAWVFREMARRTPAERSTGSSEPLWWVQAPEFNRVSAFSGDDETRLRAMEQAALLVVDEVGDEVTGLAVSTLRDLWMAREAAGRRTVITSNLEPQAFRAKYGDAMWDRAAKRGILPDCQKMPSRRRREG
jgi:hypothetical protein